MTTAPAQRERCRMSELWPEECAHCRGLQLDVDDLAEVQIAKRWRAVRSGTCPTCEHQYDEGDLIMRTADGELVCERCQA